MEARGRWGGYTFDEYVAKVQWILVDWAGSAGFHLLEDPRLQHLWRFRQLSPRQAARWLLTAHGVEGKHSRGWRYWV